MIYTKNQQEALDYRGGNLLIIACAGSGKELASLREEGRIDDASLGEIYWDHT